MKLNLRVITVIGLLASCTTTGGHRVEVLERSNEGSARPEWANIDQVKTTSHGKNFFVSTFTAVGDDVSATAALNASDRKALSEPMLGLVDAFLEQNQVGEELRSSESVSQRIISATKRYVPPMPSLEVSNRYYEKVAITAPNASPVYETRAFSRAVVSVDDYERAKREYLARLKGDSEVKKILQEVGQKQRDEVMNTDIKSEDNKK